MFGHEQINEEIEFDLAFWVSLGVVSFSSLDMAETLFRFPL